MPPRKRARAAASTATIACDRSAIVLKQSAAIGGIYEAGELCDGEVKLGQHTYKVSRMVLASASPFFKAAFSGTMREGVQQAVALDSSLTATAVEALLKFAHAPGPITVPEDEVEDLIAAADMLNIVDAVPLIASQLVTSVTCENCLVRLGLAGRYDLDALAKAALQTIDTHFADVAASDAFRGLPVEAVTRLLKTEDMDTKEAALYEAILAWVAHDASRAADFDALLELVRLPDLGMAYLVANVMHAPPVLASARAQQLVREAVLWLTVPEQRDALASPRTEPRRKYLDVRFDTMASSGVLLENDGKKVLRTAYTHWKGARARPLGSLWRRATWKLRVTPATAHPFLNQHELGFFLGVARDDVNLDLRSSTCTEKEGKIGANITSAQRGDEFTITADRERSTLTVDGNRDEVVMDGIPCRSFEIAWPIVAGEIWHPYVLMNLGGDGAPVEASCIEVVD
jgi:hypothetical protein